MRILILTLLFYHWLTALATAGIPLTSSPECHEIDEHYTEIECKEGDAVCRDRKLQCRYGARWKGLKDFLTQFQEAIRTNDKHKLAEIVPYPLTVYAYWFDPARSTPDRDDSVANKLYEIKNKQEFLSVYSQIFPKFIREEIAGTAIYDKLHVYRLITSLGQHHRMALYTGCEGWSGKYDDLENCAEYYMSVRITYFFDVGEVNADFTRRRRPVSG